MTIYYDITDADEIGIWLWDQDPATDAPTRTQSPPWNLAGDPPQLIFDMLWDEAVNYYNTNLGDGTVDFHLVRLIAETAFEQIEQVGN